MESSGASIAEHLRRLAPSADSLRAGFVPSFSLHRFWKNIGLILLTLHPFVNIFLSGSLSLHSVVAGVPDGPFSP